MTLTGPAAAAQHHVLLTEDGARLGLISCVLRNTGDGWHILNDAGHSPSGVTKVTQRSAYLELTHATTALKVSSWQVTPDETFAARGVHVGASVGLASTRLFLYTKQPANGAEATPANPANVVVPGSNFWVTALMELPALP
ncbi:hypothetical protein [Streptomyces sp. NBC_01716]|uniref:hypothetical protein n=1 Tax=Streptomyces sp. NBC_01716 TaxID=2975917 RepID=UPI002E351929|nr:hypothetical protein [Streptomyces sp. NBC_01716]